MLVSKVIQSTEIIYTFTYILFVWGIGAIETRHAYNCAFGVRSENRTRGLGVPFLGLAPSI